MQYESRQKDPGRLSCQPFCFQIIEDEYLLDSSNRQSEHLATWLSLEDSVLVAARIMPSQLLYVCSTDRQRWAVNTQYNAISGVDMLSRSLYIATPRSMKWIEMARTPRGGCRGGVSLLWSRDLWRPLQDKEISVNRVALTTIRCVYEWHSSLVEATPSETLYSPHAQPTAPPSKAASTCNARVVCTAKCQQAAVWWGWFGLCQWHSTSIMCPASTSNTHQ